MTARNSRQGFLGERESYIADVTLGIVGLNGGGSHLVQQAGHVGFSRYVLFDPDCVDESNLNRNVLADVESVRVGAAKTTLAETRLRALLGPAVQADARGCRWQESPEALRRCDIILACVDTFAERAELEACARRFLIPLIDIGVDVHQAGGEPPRMAGQVILSMPGSPCMRCLGFLTEERLAREAARYGAAGGRPQVVWANGVLGSTAIGIAVDLLTDWTGQMRGTVYLSYDANSGAVVPHARLPYAPAVCTHFPPAEVGIPRLVPL